ncbi:MAG: hypothetical protein PVJ86_11700 [Phycisphaerales bacterium]|jgi:hypothetical protein
MKTKQYWILVIVLLVFLVALGHVTRVAGEAKKVPQFRVLANQREVLAGLQGVMVVAGELKGAEKHGLTERVVRNDVESQLRRHGVKVFSEEEWGRTPGMPWLYVDVILSIDEGAGPAAVSIKVELYERTLLLRNTELVANGATWRKWRGGFLGLNDLDEVRKSVTDLAGEFIQDYFVANPKKQ